MTTLELDRNEQEVLLQILDRRVTSIDHEIGHTDHGEFKRVLRRKRASSKASWASCPSRPTRLP